MAEKKKSSTKKTPAKSTKKAEPVMAYVIPDEILSHYKMSASKARRLPERAFRFLMGISRHKGIRKRLLSVGLGDDVLKYGWSLLMSVAGNDQHQAPDTTTEEQEAALAELDRWDEPNFSKLKAVLRHRYPSQLEYLLSDLSATQGPDALFGIQTLLSRLEHLEQGSNPHRGPHMSQQDKEAVAYLAKRGIVTQEEREHLRHLIGVVTAPSDKAKESEDAVTAHIEEQNKNLVRLAIWIDEWTELARTTGLSRRDRITLGIAQLRKKANVAAETDEEEPEEEGEEGPSLTTTSPE